MNKLGLAKKEDGAAFVRIRLSTVITVSFVSQGLLQIGALHIL
jgi:hypothetical protein